MNQIKQRYAQSLAIVFLFVFLFASLAHAKGEKSNKNQRFAINFNEAMNRCLQSGCTNIEEVIGFFADESSYLDDTGQLWKGKANIRKQFLRVQPAAETSDRIEGIEVGGSVVTLHLERRRAFKAGKSDTAEVKPHVQIILLKGGRIVRLISVISPDEK